VPVNNTEDMVVVTEYVNGERLIVGLWLGEQDVCGVRFRGEACKLTTNKDAPVIGWFAYDLTVLPPLTVVRSYRGVCDGGHTLRNSRQCFPR